MVVPAAADADRANALMLAAAGGCPRAFQAFYVLTSQRVFAIVLRLSPDPGEAEDLLQDTYLKAWRRSHQFDASRGSALQWLSVMARHGAIDRMRSRAVRPKLRPVAEADEPEAGDGYGGLPCPRGGPLDSLIERQRAQALWSSLEALPDDQRRSLTLAFLNGLSHSEVARQMDRPAGTVKSWVRRSLATLRQTLPTGL